MIKHFSYSMTNLIYNTAASNSLIFQMSDMMLKAYTIGTLRWLVYIVSYNVKCIHYRNSEVAGIYSFLQC